MEESAQEVVVDGFVAGISIFRGVELRWLRKRRKESGLERWREGWGWLHFLRIGNWELAIISSPTKNGADDKP